MSHYRHLTLIEKEKLLFFTGRGSSAARMALALGRSRSTIRRAVYKDITDISDRETWKVENGMNRQPRKILGCPPAEVLFG